MSKRRAFTAREPTRRLREHVEQPGTLGRTNQHGHRQQERHHGRRLCHRRRGLGHAQRPDPGEHADPDGVWTHS